MTEHIDPIETARNNVLAAVLALQQCTQTGGTRAQIPGTNNLIMVGPADWIAANVPGVEVMVEQSGDELAAFEEWARRTHRRPGTTFDRAHDGTYKDNRIAAKWAAWQARARLAATTQTAPVADQLRTALKSAQLGMRSYGYSYDGAKLASAIESILSATTQASTAQAESDAVDPNVFFDALFDYKDSPMSVSDGQRFFDKISPAATSSTDAQAAAEVRDAALTNVWNDALTEVRAQVKDMQEAAYTFGEYSKEAVTTALDGVLDVIDELRSAGDTGGAS